MTKKQLNNKRHLMDIGITIAIVFAYFETASIWNGPWNWERLLSGMGFAAILVYVSLLLTGLYFFFSNLRRKSGTQHKIEQPRSGIMNWIVIGGVILAAAWVYLYSPWQDFLSRPWLQLVFATGFSLIIQRLAAQSSNSSFGWSELALTLGFFIYPRVVSDLRAFTDLPLLYRGAMAAGLALVFALAFVLYHPFGETIRHAMLGLREKLGGGRWFVIPLLWLSPILYQYAIGAENYILLANLRFLVLLIMLWVAAYLTCSEPSRLVTPEALGVNFSILVFVFAVNARLLLVVTYPFSLTWSEGNRFYDYSLMFGQSLYDHDGVIVNPYSSPGRYGLWGILFLWQNAPIWIHRLWNLILHTLLPFLFAFLITRKLTPSALRVMVMMWISLFLVTLAPLHPPFVLASVVITLFAFDESPVKRGLSLAIAGVYVGISRWTWAFAPGALGALIDLFLFYPKREGHWFKRLIPTIILTLLGVLPGLLLNLDAFHSTTTGESLTAQQPLLWYRLFPNDTLGPGVLLLALYYTGPILLLLAWWMLSLRLQLDWIQKTAVWGALTGFFGVGLVISTKIGGGGDLHNLDMYLMTLLTVGTLSLMLLSRSTEKMQWPLWTLALVLLLALQPVYGFTPFVSNASYHSRLGLADSADTEEALKTIRMEVEKYAEQGDVLFMDQRQLLTFGYITDIPFISEYEKKYMMDQAMASNAPYFEIYYQDLADKRFALIVSEPLKVVLKTEMGGIFSEENDAWVTWVSAPTLCYYEPILTDRAVGVQLLVPKVDTSDCSSQLP